MDLYQSITSEHSKSQTDKIVNWVGNDQDRFKNLLDLFLGNDIEVARRAGWPLGDIASHQPNLILPHIHTFIGVLEKPLLPSAVKRNVMRVLQFINIPQDAEEIVLHHSFRLFENKREDIAIRVFAMSVLANICQRIPELSNELIPLIEDELPYGSPGFVSRGKKVLKNLKQLRAH